MPTNIYIPTSLFAFKNILEKPDEDHIIDMSWEAFPYTQYNFTDPAVQEELSEFYECRDLIEEQGIKVKVITGRFDIGGDDPQPYTNNELWGGNSHKILPEDFELHTFQTAFMYHSVCERDLQLRHLKHLGLTKHHETEVKDMKLLVSLMHIAKSHRLATIDLLIERKVIPDSIVRFCNNVDHWQHLTSPMWQHHNEYFTQLKHEIIAHAPYILAPYKYHDVPDQKLFLDPFYSKGLFDISCETHHNVNFMSQKSFQPILWKKPFCILGSPNANMHFKNMGFELFDEVFDYSVENPNPASFYFAEEDYQNSYLPFPHDTYKRHYDKLLNNLWDIERTPSSYMNWKMKLYDKCEHNLNRFCEILFDDSYIPEPLLEKALDGHIRAPVILARSICLSDPYYEKYIPIDKRKDRK